MKYQRITELDINVFRLRTRHYLRQSAAGSKCFAGQNSFVSNSDLGMDECVAIYELDDRLARLGIREDFYRFVGGNSKVNMVMYAADVEAALERCMSGRVVEVV